jgi:predicted nucleotidyltransferase
MNIVEKIEYWLEIMDKDIIGKIKQLSTEAKKYFEFEKVVLYGSYANGSHNSESDIDVAFFVKEIKADYWKLSAKLFELVDKIDNRIEPLIINEATDKSGFAQNILKNGIAII